MRILYYANMHIKESDGPSNHVLWVCRELGNRGHRVVLFTYPFSKFLQSNRFTAIQVPDWLARVEWLGKYSRSFWRLIAYLLVYLYKPDVIYQRDRMDDNFPLHLSRRARVPLAIELNGWIPTDYSLKHGLSGYDLAINAIRERYSQSSILISTTAGACKLARKTFNLSEDRAVYIQNGVDLERFIQPISYIHHNEKKLVIGYIFGYHPDLDVNTILTASSILKSIIQFELWLVTYNQNMDHWEAKIEELGLTNHVKFFHSVSRLDIPRLLWKMDVCLAIFTLSYIKTYNGVEGALKLWEYWASRRSVIVTDIPESDSYYHHFEKRFLAVPPEDPEALAAAIKTLYDSPDLAEELARNGHEYVKIGHTWADTAREIEEALRKAINRS